MSRKKNHQPVVVEESPENRQAEQRKNALKFILLVFVFPLLLVLISLALR